METFNAIALSTLNFEVILDFQLTQKQVLIKATQGTFQPGEFKEFFFKYLSHIHVGIYTKTLFCGAGHLDKNK
jgi:hypothetical protein